MKINEIISDNRTEILTQLAEKILTDCQYYFSINPKARQSINQTLFRGMGDKMTGCADLLNPIAVRSDRRPKTTTKFKHTIVDDWLLEQFHWRPRSAGLFTVAEHRIANLYGGTCAIFPIGTFKCLWSLDINDLTDFLDQNLSRYRYQTQAEQIAGKDEIDSLLSNCRWNETLNQYFEKYPDHELILGCKEFYAIPYNKNHPCGSIYDLLPILQKLM